jgi:hypothetical protein
MYVTDLVLLGENINAIKRHTEALRDTAKEAALKHFFLGDAGVPRPVFGGSASTLPL